MIVTNEINARIDAAVASGEMTRDRAYTLWLETRPQGVRDLAARFPYGGPVTVDGNRHYVLGYSELEGDHVGLIVTPVDPAADYDAAVAFRSSVCGACLDEVRRVD